MNHEHLPTPETRVAAEALLPPEVRQELIDTDAKPVGHTAVEAVRMPVEPAPVPQGWTYLIHGTNTAKWPAEESGAADVVKVTGLGLSVLTAEEVARNKQTGADTGRDYAAMGQGDASRPVEVRVVFPSEHMAGNRVATAEQAGTKAELRSDAAVARLIDGTYNNPQMPGGHPVVPRGQDLLRVGSERHEDGRLVHYYVPAGAAEAYAASVEAMTGQKIELPEVPAAAVPAAEALATPEQAATTAQPVPETVPAPVAPTTSAETAPGSSAAENFIRGALSTVPRSVMTGVLREVADNMANNQAPGVTVEGLGKLLEGYLQGKTSLGVDAAALTKLADRVNEIGFDRSAGGIWEEQGARSAAGDVSRAARQLLKVLVTRAVRGDVPITTT